MAYDEAIARRLRKIFADRADIVEKKMFGGIAFMLSGNMCLGVREDKLMARVGPEQYEEALKKTFCRKDGFYREAHERFCLCESPRYSLR